MAKRQKNTPRERFLYLRELVTEFQDTSSVDAKEQVLANLGNFAYDPDNYIHMKELNIVDLFLDNLEDENKNLVEFAIGGICNLCLDKNLKQLIYKRGGVQKVINCLSSEREEIVLSAITTLMFLVYPESKAAITNASVIDCMLRFKESNNRRISNLASVFLQDYCTSDQIQNAKMLSSTYSNKHVSHSGT
ncbi:armadillo repeat-containing protein 7-like [Argiope bruennichi]|uniref:Armadillo repeat-containing protein 7 n=1 Tax=Argiope bruennichi TaxID=94029 RepID=A0A8T0ETU9_ARGBR|nr:armadillo repeat-containing protein 7-like [Argiope bruennichi]KAF8781736.1 Armadillo repeat-containing protein 7 [Argiope bruennichi]